MKTVYVIKKVPSNKTDNSVYYNGPIGNTGFLWSDFPLHHYYDSYEAAQKVIESTLEKGIYSIEKFFITI